MKFILLTSLFLTFGNVFNDAVYVCDSSTATKYHLSKDCRGLKNCKAKIVKVKLKDAKKEGKELCGWEK